jgi:hypothetical protein
VDVTDAPNSADSSLPQVAIIDDPAGPSPANPDGLLYVVLHEESTLYGTDFDDAFAARSTDGITWTNHQPLNCGAGDPINDVDEIWLHGDGSMVYATWEEDGVGIDPMNPTGCIISNNCGNEAVFFRRSLDGGITWEPTQLLSTFALSNPSDPCSYNDVDSPTVISEGSTVLVTWIDNVNGDDDVWVAASQAFGAPGSWLVQSIEVNTAGDTNISELDIENGTVWIVFEDFENGNGECHAMTSRDGGQTWGIPDPMNPAGALLAQEVNLTPSVTTVAGSGIRFQDVAFSSGRVWVAYAADFNAQQCIDPNTNLPAAPNGGNDDDSRQAYISYSLDGGATWTTEVDLNPGTGGIELQNQFVRVKAQGDVCVVTMELLPYGNNDLGYAWTTDAGATGFNFQMVTNSLGDGDVDSPGERHSEWFALLDDDSWIGLFYENQPFGQNEMFAAGGRLPYQVLPDTTLALGTPIGFGIGGVIQANPGTTFVTALSTTPYDGSLPICPGPFCIPFAIDATTLGVIADPVLAPLLSGSVATNGIGSALLFNNPGLIGVTFETVAIVLDPLGTLSASTDGNTLNL